MCMYVQRACMCDVRVCAACVHVRICACMCVYMRVCACMCMKLPSDFTHTCTFQNTWLYSLIYTFFIFREKGLLCISVTHLSDLAKYHKNTEHQCQKPVPMWNKYELKENYPLMSFNDENYSGFLDESAGILYSDKCLQAFQVYVYKLCCWRKKSMLGMCSLSALPPA